MDFLDTITVFLIARLILSLFYKTFDAVDGKQARRTNSSSPLGELFDHGNISILFLVPPCFYDSFLMDHWI